MLQIRRHCVDDYEQLLHLDAGNLGTLSYCDRECLREVGDFLAATGAWRRFALWLLHKHFVPHDTELFFERAILGEKRTETTPVSRFALTSRVSPVAVRFRDGSGPAPQVVGLEYANLRPWEPTPALDDEDQPVLAGIAHRLRTYDKLDRFGVRLIRNPLALTRAELLLETCDSTARTMHCHVASRTAVSTGRSTIETTWRWRPVGDATHPVVMQYCIAADERARRKASIPDFTLPSPSWLPERSTRNTAALHISERQVQPRLSTNA
jgi:hypothetical protein